MIKLCVLLLFRGDGERVTLWTSLYLDEHGEADLELRRGKALYLADERKEQLRRLLLSKGVDHDTLVLSKTQRLHH